MNSEKFTPENTATIERLLAARNRNMSASQAVKSARGDVSVAAKQLAAEAIAAAEKRHASASPKASAATLNTIAELLAMPTNQAQALNEKCGFGNAGREHRRVIKRAFATASPSEKSALLEKYGPALSAFPNEQIA